jgi:hypothetical protein
VQAAFRLPLNRSGEDHFRATAPIVQPIDSAGQNSAGQTRGACTLACSVHTPVNATCFSESSSARLRHFGTLPCGLSSSLSCVFHANLVEIPPVSRRPLNVLRSFIGVAAVCNAHNADQLRRIVDDVQHAPIACPNALLVLVAFQLFASCRPRVVRQRQNLTIYPGVSSSASNSFCAGRLISSE